MKITEIRGADGLYRCSVCGVVTRRAIDYPVFDGRGSTRRLAVRVMCRCQEAVEAEEKAREKFQADMQKISELRKLSLMDARLMDAAFSNYLVKPENERAYKLAVRYVERFDDMMKSGQGIMFFGPVGTGKSYTAAAIANELINRKHSAVMTSFIKLLEKMRSFDTDDGEYIDRLNHADLLVIDDLGAERSTDTALENVYSIVDSRYRSRKPLILTTNLEMEQIKNPADIRYARIYDRIVEICYPVKMNGFSRRKQEAVRRFDEMKRILEG